MDFNEKAIDGAGVQSLLNQLETLSTAGLGNLSSVQTLRQVWQQQYAVEDGQLRWRNQAELPPAAERIESPYDGDARFSKKREETWGGYKVHLTETCNDELPHLITHVETTLSTDPNINALNPIHQDLSQRQLLPSEHAVDMGYGSGESISTSQTAYGVELLCPVHSDTSWQAKNPDAFDLACFSINWEAQQVTCPAGQTSRSWTTTKTSHGKPAIFVRFSPIDCTPCPARSLCTRSKEAARELTLLPQPAYLALQNARQRQLTPAFAQRYAVRAGIEVTLSQAVATLDMRRTRYIGLVKTHLQHLLTAAALNLLRIANWLNGKPRAQTRYSPFAALAA